MDAMSYAKRRAALNEACPNWIFILPAAPRALRNRTVEHAWRQDSDLLYLTGWEHAQSCLVLRPDGAATLYIEEANEVAARWTGALPSPEQAAAQTGVEDVRSIRALVDELDDHLEAGQVLGWRLGRHPALDVAVVGALERVAARSRRAGRYLMPVRDPHGAIGPQRLRKDAGEIARLRAAAAVNVAAHAELMHTARAGDSGLGLVGRFEAVCRAGGAVRMAYETIVARGDEATCLHASPTRTPLRAGELVLVDAGLELDGYACDVTRTWPVSPRFTAGQAALYEGVLAAQQAAIAAARPGATLDAIHEAACAVLAEVCARLGLPGELKRWYPHPTSHWIGLDVHDAGPYACQGEPVVLEPGMIFTVEPGLYLDATDAEVPEALRGLGVRIEDVVLITEDGAEVLTAEVPKAREEVERVRGSFVQ